MNQQKQRPFSIKIFVPDVGWATSLPMRLMKNNDGTNVGWATSLPMRLMTNKQKMGNTVAHPTLLTAKVRVKIDEIEEEVVS
ncbi:hypothetical protein KJ966_21860 [bacterium]|nr:hypothetical protein [bacterium]